MNSGSLGFIHQLPQEISYALVDSSVSDWLFLPTEAESGNGMLNYKGERWVGESTSVKFWLRFSETDVYIWVTSSIPISLIFKNVLSFTASMEVNIYLAYTLLPWAKQGHKDPTGFLPA